MARPTFQNERPDGKGRSRTRTARSGGRCDGGTIIPSLRVMGRCGQRRVWKAGKAAARVGMDLGSILVGSSMLLQDASSAPEA